MEVYRVCIQHNSFSWKFRVQWLTNQEWQICWSLTICFHILYNLSSSSDQETWRFDKFDNWRITSVLGSQNNVLLLWRIFHNHIASLKLDKRSKDFQKTDLVHQRLFSLYDIKKLVFRQRFNNGCLLKVDKLEAFVPKQTIIEKVLK